MVTVAMAMTTDLDLDLDLDPVGAVELPTWIELPNRQHAPTRHTPTRRQHVPQRSPQTNHGTTQAPAPTPGSSPSAGRTGAAKTDNQRIVGHNPTLANPSETAGLPKTPPRYPPWACLYPALPAILLSWG